MAERMDASSLPVVSAAAPAVDDPIQSAYVRAVRRRDAMRRRMEFWEAWRGTVMLPFMLAGAGVGLGIGFGLEHLFSLPALARFLGATVGIAFTGRFLADHYHPSRLIAAQQRVRQLEERLARR